ncbi:MAG: lipoate--protein ligase [Bacteroidales bacterium]|nr:lipoate--protein ligase [Bacteroidales bacterium]
MLYITDNNTDPYWNLAAEEYLLKNFTQPIFRLWRNSSSIIIGQYQNAVAEIDMDYVKSNDIKVVRRLTGGGAVFHDLGNLNFTFIEPHTKSEEANAMFRRFTAPILEALNKLGVKAYLEGRNDLLIDGRKFSGNAMCISNKRVLQHGCMLFSASMNNLGAALKSRPEKFIGKAVQSNVSRVTNISSHLPQAMSVEEFQQYLGEYICARHTLAEPNSADSAIIPYKYTEEDLKAIGMLKETKYMLDSWNFGHSPAYSSHNIKKFPGGLLEFHFTVKKGSIDGLEIFGDYFFTKPTEEFTAAIIGTEHTEDALLAKLSEVNVSEYFSGVSKEELCEMFF